MNNFTDNPSSIYSMETKVMLLMLGLWLCIGVDVSGQIPSAICSKGFILNQTGCIDEDECSGTEIPSCGPNSQCFNTNGSYYCTCAVGYRSSKYNFTKDESVGLCLDINECVESPPCNISQSCLNTHGSFKCVCRHGYRSAKDGCKDVDECVESSGQPICGLNGKCINTQGGYFCNCDRGYHFTLSQPLPEAQQVADPCVDINECLMNLTMCGRHGRCINTPGSYLCSCMRGFRNQDRNNSKSPCEDVNECVESSGQPICGLNGKCSNFEGSYLCSCNLGYRYTQYEPQPDALQVADPCEDFSERVTGPSLVDFTRNDPHGIHDVNECVEGTHSCHASFTCINTPGAFQCVCPDGFRGDCVENEVICIDIDECLNLTVCGPHGRCINTAGSYLCSCPAGFRGQERKNSKSPCKEWIYVLKNECKDEKADCTLNKLLDLEKNLTETDRIPPENLFPVLDNLLTLSPEAQEDDVLELTERLLQKVKTSSINGTERFKFNGTVVDIASIGPNTSKPSQLTKIDVLEIDLWAIAEKNNGSASVVVLTSDTMHKVFNNSHYHARDAEQTYMAAKVVVISLPQVQDKTLSTPINLTFRNFKDPNQTDVPACVFWNKGSWITDGCHVADYNSTMTVCTCTHLSTFALIMQINPTKESNPVVDKLGAFFVVVGLIFLTLALMTFVLCRRNSRVTNMARLNLSISLLLAHFLFLITQTAVNFNIHRAACKFLAGVLHFLFLSSFVWMSAEAILLFMSVRKLRQIKAKDRTGPHWRYKLLIGYGIPLVIVSVSAMIMPDGHGSDQCWLKPDQGFTWSFLGPVVFILIGNIILFVIIFLTIHLTLTAAKSDASKVKYTRVLLLKIMAQCVILGCPWIFLMASSESTVLEIIFVILMSQQGTVIFLIHCVLNDEARKQYASLWRKYDPRSKPTTSVALTSTQPCSETQPTSLPVSQTEDENEAHKQGFPQKMSSARW